jgi:hypothetical protein
MILWLSYEYVVQANVVEIYALHISGPKKYKKLMVTKTSLKAPVIFGLTCTGNNARNLWYPVLTPRENEMGRQVGL